MRKVLQKILMAISAAVVLSMPVSVLAAPYGSGSYGVCPYAGDCPAPPQNETVTPPVNPPTEQDNIVRKDIDGDGNLEEAIDEDGNADNGYEKFNDPDGSSDELAAFDGDGNGQTTFIVDTDGDGEPDVYWSPSADHTSDVKVDDRPRGLYWLYTDADNDAGEYLVRSKTPSNNEFGGGTNVPSGNPSDAAKKEQHPHRLTGSTLGAPYASLGQLVQKIPKPLAYSFPYMLLLLIGILVLRLLMQAKREISRIQVILSTIQQEKQLLLEKENFLMLASHYLRTPITIVKGNVELMQSLKQIGDDIAQKLQLSISSILEQSNGLLTKLENNEGLAQISNPEDAREAQVRTVISPMVIGPVIAIFVLIFIMQFVFIDFRVTNPNILDFLAQVGLGVLLFQLFVSKFRSRQISQKNREDQERVLNQQRQLDAARSNLINEAGQVLGAEVAKLGRQIDELTVNGADTSKIRRGYDQLQSITNKFVFATKLEAQSLRLDKQQFNSDQLIDTVVKRNKDKADARGVNIETQPSNLMMVQNQGMLNIVLDSLVDNAVKYSDEKGNVKVAAGSENQNFNFVVEDHGKGMTPEQLDMLFKPFSRAESAETFNTEGLGFSLYLDRLIMHYLGGDIKIDSVPGQGTRTQLMLPVL